MSLSDTFFARPVAHRALHDATRPENTLAAIRAAMDAGYGIEVDVQPAADGTPMVFHDYALDRLTGQEGWVREQPVETLGDLRVKGTGERVPTLAQVLDTIGGAVPLIVEIKDQDGALGPAVGALEKAVADVLAGYAGPVAVMSFNPNSVRVFGGHAPDIPRGLVTDAFTEEDWPMVPAPRRAKLASLREVAASGAQFISHNVRHLDMVEVEKVKRGGLTVLCWTVRSAEQADRARRIADQITFEGFTPVE
ncbi:glycerophosphodiester phosphodiesterase family protein [Roseobacter sp. HKCCA0434]|uniref:glycerophosphodiester phosphodiesterase family protein n=1 Tax=Roseobacter sp. HKCCA0434 TaxID=3079297 RepID=UPI002905B33A|nr:glycerophosphodiester phosphodiesterase family protein [Roseobacter sp. HKCCA0434]